MCMTCVYIALVFFVSELQLELELTCEEKQQAITDLEAVTEQLRETREEVSFFVLPLSVLTLYISLHNKCMSMARLQQEIASPLPLLWFSVYHMSKLSAHCPSLLK